MNRFDLINTNRGDEARMMGALVGLIVAQNLTTGALWIFEGRGMMLKVAMLSGYREQLPWVMLGLAMLIGAYAAIRAIGLFATHHFLVNKIGGRLIGLAAILWFYLGISARNMDVKYTVVTMLLNAAMCLATWLILARAKNARQKEIQEGAA